MGCNRRHLLRRKPAADRQHLAKRIIEALSGPPSPQLSRHIVGRLARERRIARPATFAAFAMALRAGLQTPRGVAFAV